MPDDTTTDPPGGVGARRGWDPAVVARADALAAERKRRRAGHRRRGLIEWVVAIVVAVVVALVIKTWVAQAFVIPTGSMENTLLISDRVLVSKLTYDFSDIDRGDVIVFDNPDPKPGQPAQLIKRIVGLPGDRISALDGQLVVNGEVQVEPYVKPTSETTLSGACSRYADDGSITVPEGHVFVMGDNRQQSLDGRCFGPVDIDEIVGKAFLRIWPLRRIGGL